MKFFAIEINDIRKNLMIVAYEQQLAKEVSRMHLMVFLDLSFSVLI